MYRFVRVAVWALAVLTVCSACSYQRKVRLKKTGLPEHVYKTPMKNDYMASRVGVFNFNEPPYALGTGHVAGELLYEEVLSRQVFAVVAHEPGFVGQPYEIIKNIAMKKGYDLVVLGEVVYFFEGSDHHAARVDERMRVIDVKANKTLWYAKAVEIGPHVPLLDLAVVQGYGAPAPSTKTLFKRNAEKFAQMLLTLPSQELWNEEKGTTWKEKPQGGVHEIPEGHRPFLDIPFEGQEFESPPVERHHSVDKRQHHSSRMPLTRGEKPNRTMTKPPTPQATQTVVQRAPDLASLTDPIYFQLDKASIVAQAKNHLEKKALLLKAHPDVIVEIQGHCDERGTQAYNMALGDQRAQSAKKYLVGRGVAASRLETVSYGRERPVDSSHNESAWAKNRRVEFVPLEKK